VSVLVSLSLFFYTRKSDRDPRSILNLGQGYMVFTAFSLGLTFHWAPMPMNNSISPQISWIGAVVLMFAGMVPSTPVKTLLAGIVAVSMNPIAMWLARARGLWNFESATDPLLMHYPDYLSSASPSSSRTSSPGWDKRSRERERWEAISSASCWAVVAWVKSTGQLTACWRGRRRSS
jgi:hypothetical protein